MGDKGPSPWFVFDTSNPDAFGAGIAKGKEINPEKFERSVKDFDEALGTVSIPIMAEGRDFTPLWIFKDTPVDLWSSERNPFVRDYAPYRTENRADPRPPEFSDYGERVPLDKVEELPREPSDTHPFPVNPDGSTLLYSGIPIPAIADAVGAMIRGYSVIAK